MMDETSTVEIIQPLLLPNERLLWTGQPPRGFLLRPEDALLVPFSLMFCGFAIFWEANVVHGKPGRHGPSEFMVLWGIPFVVIGLYLVFGRFIADVVQRRKMAYGLTTQRVIIAGGILGRKVQSHRLDGLTEIGLVEHAQGTGTIDLAPQLSRLSNRFSRGQNPWQGASYTRLERINNAREVYERILVLQAGGAAGR